MDLTTSYLGLKLPHPLMPGASPLSADLGMVRRLEDAGAAAIVLHSLFEEQVRSEQFRQEQDVQAAEDTFFEALTYHPRREEYLSFGPAQYLERLRRVKETVSVPVIASLNGVTPGTWVEYATQCQQAGADALELNVYFLAADPLVSGADVDRRLIEVVSSVCRAVSVPVAVKLSPFFSSMPHLTRQIEEAGAAGLVLFNRFYQPDIDVERLDVSPELRLSTSDELLLRLRWLAILYGHTRLSLACTGGVHSGLDAVKAVMAGADALQLVSALLLHGPEHLAHVRHELAVWLEEHEYASLAEMKGSMSLRHCPEPEAFERGNYVRILQGGYKLV